MLSLHGWSDYISFVYIILLTLCVVLQCDLVVIYALTLESETIV